MTTASAWNSPAISRRLRVKHLLFIASLGLAGPTVAGDDLVPLLEQINNEITMLKYSGKTGDHRYDLAWDTDFSCSLSLREYRDYEGDRWIRLYRFELSDLEPGRLLMAKDRRRAISYYGEKYSNGVVKKFSPKKISSIRLHAPDDSKLPGLFDAAIRLCEERNTF